MSSRSPERAAKTADDDPATVVLSLYISGPTPRSATAIVNVRKLCEAHLAGRYRLAVIDLSLAPLEAARHQIIAAPTLVREAPLPERRFIGDMSDTGKLLAGLDVFAPDQA
jgi:circadian clock protein KaiB